MGYSASFLPRGITKEKKKRFRMERQRKELQPREKARNEGHRAYSAQDLKKKGEKGGLQSVCRENECAPHVMGEEPHAVPWGLKKAANSSLREWRRMLLYLDLLPQPPSWTSATEWIQWRQIYCSN